MDKLLHISLEDGQAHALVALTTQMAEDARRTHGAARTAAAALGRALTGAAMLGALCKGANDSVTTTYSGGGPLGSVVCVARPDGTVKGYVGDPSCDPPRKPNGKLDVGGAVGRDGRLTVVKDLGLKEPYVGQVRLASGEIAEDLAFYLTISEQTPSLVALGVRLQGEQVTAAGGVLVQPYPGCPEETLKKLEALAPRLTAISDLAQQAGDAQALAALALDGLSYTLLEERAPRYACDCNRPRIERVLLSLGEKELRAMLEEQHGACLTCHFCNQSYTFNETELTTLLEEARA